MIIGFDGKRAVFNNTGLGNYSRLVVDVLSEYYPEGKYLLFTPKAGSHPDLTPLLDRPNVSLQLPRRKPLIGAWWRSVSGMMADAKVQGVELFHGLSGELPMNASSSGIPTVLTVHDLIFKRFTQYHKAIDRHIYDMKMRHACRCATRIIAISECTKREIMHFYGTPEEKIDVVYQGCAETFRKPVSEAKMAAVSNRYDLPERFLLSVGTVEERKNLLLAVKSMKQINDHDISLVVVGRHTPYYDEIMSYATANGLANRIVPIRIGNDDLPALYHLAQAFVYPSRYEGFGIPILESLCCGTPVIAATGSCLEEAGGPGSIYVNPDSVEQITTAINRVLGDSALRNQMIESGHQYSQRFNRRAMADGLMTVYRKALATTLGD